MATYKGEFHPYDPLVYAITVGASVSTMNMIRFWRSTAFWKEYDFPKPTPDKIWRDRLLVTLTVRPMGAFSSDFQNCNTSSACRKGSVHGTARGYLS
jgi:hypothetical protein